LIAGAILAAGRGARFGAGPKQLAALDGRSLLEHAIGAMVAVAALERVVVVVGFAADEILGAVDLQRAEPLVADGWEEGQAASLRAAVDDLDGRGAAAVVVTLGDEPRMTPQAIARVIAAADGSEAAVRATYFGAPGHPVLIKRALFADVRRVRGDVGARELLQTVAVAEVECGDLGPATDVDTLEQLERLRRR
jgi:CTP:molybdopterin cytidylyltransferase MocA